MVEGDGPIKGAIAKAREWVSGYFQDPSDRDRHFIQVEPDNPMVRAEPKGFNSMVNERFHHHLMNNPLAQQFVAVIPDGRVCGAHGTVVTPDNYLIWDLSPELDNRAPTDHSMLKRQSFPPNHRTSETLGVLTYSIAFHYYHWMFEVLARLELLRRSGIHVDRYVLNRSEYIPFQNETLAALGIPDDKIIDCNESTHIQARRLLVPSFGAYTGHVPKWACEFLKRELLLKRDIKPLNGYERIYISRRDAASRQIVNEAVILPFLESRGFRVVVPGTLSATEQMQIFSSAQVVFAPHGAGLTNLTFCNPGTKVIELHTPSFINPTFWTVCNHLGLDYYYLVGKSSRGLTDGWDADDNIIVDIGELARILHLAGVA